MARGLDRGTTLGGRYRLEELVGSGGMGSVYAAQDLERGHRVAVKVLRRRYAERTEFRERFVAESRSAARIPHPHILTVHDHGVDDGWHYIVMALAPTDLASLIEQGGTLPVTRTLNVAEQIAWALDVAHGQGMVHRDVKPENVLVAPRADENAPDHAYLADFGIAKLETAEVALTRTGVFVGTVSYASPEQVTGGPLDGRSDQYALACVVFECLTGRPPFSGADADEVLRAHRGAPRPRASERRPGLPPALDAILQRGMAVGREDRFATCSAFVEAARRAVREPEATVAGTGGDGPDGIAAPESVTADRPTVARGPVAPTARDATDPTRPGPLPTAATSLRTPDGRGTEVPDPSSRLPDADRPAADPAARSVPVKDVLPTGSRRRPVLLASAVAAGVVVAVGAALVLGGGDETPASGPGRSGPSSSDTAGADRAVRQTIAAFGAARGAAATCATISVADQSGCASANETAQPASFSVRDVQVGEDLATAQIAHEPDGDRLDVSLAREDGVWRLTEIPSFDWKDADEVAVAETVIRFAGRAPGACGLLAEPIASQCGALQPPKPVRYDLTSVTAGSSGSVTGELLSGDSDLYELVDTGDAWRISAID